MQLSLHGSLTSSEWLTIQKKLWVTVYHTDQETYDIWLNEIGLSSERIILW